MVLSAKLIKEARTGAGMTQAELAKRARTSQPTVAAYESGDKVPTVATLERLLRVAGVTLTASHPPGDRQGSGLRQLIHDHRREILEMAGRHHATNVRVFGSVARGQDTDRSDIDLLVDME